ncbi:MAG: hypothetical protein ACAH79_04055 [Thermoleophilia bacterium]
MTASHTRSNPYCSSHAMGRRAGREGSSHGSAGWYGQGQALIEPLGEPLERALHALVGPP